MTFHVNTHSVVSAPLDQSSATCGFVLLHNPEISKKTHPEAEFAAAAEFAGAFGDVTIGPTIVATDTTTAIATTTADIRLNLRRRSTMPPHHARP